MTPDEHERLRERMHACAQEVLLEWMTGLLRMQYGLYSGELRARTLEAAEKKLAAAREEYSTLTLPGLHPAESDLRAALFQEAFDALSKNLLAELARGITDRELVHLLDLYQRSQQKTGPT